jgi:hypothetical protein
MMQVQEQHGIMRFVSWLRELLVNTDFQATEAQAAIIAIGLGGGLLNPYTDTFVSSPSFAAMAALAPEWVWGLALFGVGVVHLAAMIRRAYHWRRAMMFVFAVLWAFMAAMFLLSNPSGWGPVLYGILAGSSGWAYWRLSLRNG